MCYTPITIKSPYHDNLTIQTPCGKCAECRKKLRDDWFIRFREEAKGQFARFVTLTYNDENIPFDIEDDCVIHYNVEKSDLQKFFKKMRKTNKFKYFAVSEYGKLGRPHYHLILFSKHRIDVTKYWDKGFVKDLPAREGSFKYVTKYLLKGFDNVPDGSKQNFSLSSKRPAIGSCFIPKEIDDNVLSNMFYQINEVKYPLPRYYRKKIYERLNDGGETLKRRVIEELENKVTDSDLKKKHKKSGTTNPDYKAWARSENEKHKVKQFKIKQNGKI